MNPSSSLRVQGYLEYTSNQQSSTLKEAILKFWRSVGGDTSLVSDFTEAWDLREFQLGDDLTKYDPNREIADRSFLYLVCQGRVRLLGWDATLGREISTQLLLTGETFGADDLFCYEPWRYRAIAASGGCVAQITIIAEDDIDFPQQRNQGGFRARFWRPYPFIAQQSLSDCGAACLAMITQYWGKRLSLNTLRNLARVDRRGASVHSLAAAAETVGYDVLTVRASLSKLDSYDNPWIAHWQGIHYIVVWRVKGDRILICDPAIGKRWLSRSEFEAGWTGYALLLDPSDRLHSYKSEQVSLERYWQLFKHHRQLLGKIILISVLVQVFGLVTPLCTQVILDQVMLVPNFLSLNVFGVGFLILGLWRLVLTAQRQFLLDYFANRIDLSLISVGQSGSGKSTLVNLLAGLYQPNGGRIVIDGHDIAYVCAQSLRPQLGLVPQDSFLFAGTILENITLYSSQFTQEQVESVAKLAEAHNFIQQLPLGYNTQVGGSLLSLGQRQKIAIARALIRNPHILILDEATSALDAESESQFPQNLTRISQERTTLIISHRLWTVRHADSILVLDRGILVEQGTHDELIAIGGLYYHLAQLQSSL
ncbi:MAG: cysteine peptidase family C39 domain-containing protein [Gloeotrichia echinulata GP01]